MKVKKISFSIKKIKMINLVIPYTISEPYIEGEIKSINYNEFLLLCKNLKRLQDDYGIGIWNFDLFRKDNEILFFFIDQPEYYSDNIIYFSNTLYLYKLKYGLTRAWIILCYLLSYSNNIEDKNEASNIFKKYKLNSNYKVDDYIFDQFPCFDEFYEYITSTSNRIKHHVNLIYYPTTDNEIHTWIDKDNLDGYSPRDIISIGKMIYIFSKYDIEVKLSKKIKYKNDPVLNSNIGPSTLTQTLSLYDTRRIDIKDNVLLLVSVIKKICFPTTRDITIIKNIVEELYNISPHDIYFYNRLKTFYYKPLEYFDRSMLRIKELERIKWFDYTSKININNYLDYGGGDGKISLEFGKRLGLDKSQIFVADIQQWNIVQNVQNCVVSFTPLNSYILPYKDNSFDIISIFMVLHHIRNIEKVIKEIERILSPGGIIIIREHDCRNNIDSCVIDIEHSLHEIVEDGNLNINYYQDYYGLYYSKGELIKLISDTTNLKLINLDYEQPKGPTRQYYISFEKV